MNEKEEKSVWVLLAINGLLLVPIIFIIGLVVGVNIDGAISLSSDTMSSWISAVSTVAIAVLTFILAKETWYLRLAQIRQINELRKEAIRPNLEFYLLSAPVSFQFMNVHVENNGKGVARNIKFSFSGEGNNPLTENARSVVDKLNALNMLRNGLFALGSGKQRTSFIFSFIELADKLGDDAFDIRINVSMSYEDSEGRLYNSETVVDFSEYKGIGEIGSGDPIYGLYEETKKLRLIFEAAQGNMRTKRININAYSSRDRKKEQDALEAALGEQRKKGSN